MRGYCGIGIESPKTVANVGGLWRTAHALGAAFIFTVGHRYGKQPTDTTKAWRSIPLYEYESAIELVSYVPRDCKLVGVEMNDERSMIPTRFLTDYEHPERAIYVLGAEDHGVSPELQDMCDDLVEIPSAYCLNVATTGSIVLYDRVAKSALNEEAGRAVQGATGNEIPRRSR